MTKNILILILGIFIIFFSLNDKNYEKTIEKQERYTSILQDSNIEYQIKIDKLSQENENLILQNNSLNNQLESITVKTPDKEINYELGEPVRQKITWYNSVPGITGTHGTLGEKLVNGHAASSYFPAGTYVLVVGINDNEFGRIVYVQDYCETSGVLDIYVEGGLGAPGIEIDSGFADCYIIGREILE